MSVGGESSLSLQEICERYSCEAFFLGKGNSLGAEKIASSDEVWGKKFFGLAPLSHAQNEHVSFFTNAKYLEDALACGAGAILCTQADAELLSVNWNRTGHGGLGIALVCAEPYVLFARLAQFYFRPIHPYSGQSPQCYVDASAVIAPGATLFPFCFVGPGARIGARTIVYSGVFVGAGTHIGEDCILYPNSVVREGCRIADRCILNPGAVVGGDGFGFAPSGMENVKIPQIGGVVLDNDVEVGANSSIDRGALLDTKVGEQTKIDSLVMVAHNVKIGKACFLAGQSGVAGSSELGNRVTLAGQVGVSGHIKIGDNATLLAKSGVSKNLPPNGIYNGIPARPNREYLIVTAAMNRLALRKKNKKEEQKETD